MHKKSKHKWIVDRSKAGVNLGKTLVPEISAHTGEGRETTSDRSKNEKNNETKFHLTNAHTLKSTNFREGGSFLLL